MGSVKEEVNKIVEGRDLCGPPSSTWGLEMVGIMVKDRQMFEYTTITAIIERTLKRFIIVCFEVNLLKVELVQWRNLL
jgi:hypothetical protein